MINTELLIAYYKLVLSVVFIDLEILYSTGEFDTVFSKVEHSNKDLKKVQLGKSTRNDNRKLMKDELFQGYFGEESPGRNLCIRIPV